MGRLAGKVALVTGAASGIGAATARVMAREGAHVVLTDVQDDRGAAVAAEFGGAYRRQDVTSEAAWIALTDAIKAEHGRLDVVVNNAGIFIGGTIEETTEELWDKVLGVNLKGLMWGCKHGLRIMKDNPGGPKGSIVNISSITGYVGLASGAAYSASKGGVRLLTKAVAVHAARTYRDIRCNSVHPGVIDTPMNQAAFDASPDPNAMRAMFAAIQPNGRMTTPEEIANACLFLASDEASSVNGAEILIDGGWLAAPNPL
ncbi:MAG: SDR family oxidoreductase [Alphaproteobacteria bacterium]|nr:SDR family oxidoreductase [Alphaproteobacteria bacterium]